MKEKRGITLVSLVVTIIVLIILAGVSINLTLGENGIITIAKKARENMELAKADEERQLNELYEQIVTEGGLSGNVSDEAIIRLAEFKREIASALTDIGIETAENADISTMASNIRGLTGETSADKVSYNNTNSGFTATNVQSAIDELNTNLNMKYNPETDMIQIYSNGKWNDWKKSGFMTFNIYKNGVDNVGLNSRRNGTTATSPYLIYNNNCITLYGSQSDGQPIQVYSNIDITNYSKLKIKFKCTELGSSGNITIGLRDTLTNSLSEETLIYNINDNPTVGNIDEMECDISGYIGNKYIYVGSYRASHEIYEIILE